MKKAIYILIIIAIPCLVFGQASSIFGTVKNQNSEPLPFVNVYIKDSVLGTATDTSGKYSLAIKPNIPVTIVFSFIGLKTQEQTLTLQNNETKKMDIIMLNDATILPEHIIKAERERESTKTEINVEETKKSPTVGGGVEDIIKSQPGVSSNNELSSQYSVRGGNFDENLVYVNEIEVYRPLLTRSGQQEGLSFVNPDLTKKILFSAGGFNAEYGDKMSSVLDITYKKPTSFKGSVTASLLGSAFHLEGISKNKKLSYLIGSRYKSNKYLLNSLPTKGEYNPVFFDTQALLNYKTSKKSNLEILGNYSVNKYSFIPKSSTSSFGTATESLRLRVFFEGEEADKFRTGFGAIKYTYKVDSSLQLKFISSTFNSVESEAFDILGEYNLEEIDPTGGDNGQNIGTGKFRRHARNDIDVTVFNLAHRGKKIREKSTTEWQIKYQKEIIDDIIEQWQITDSAGYTTPIQTNTIEVQNAANSQNTIKSNRYTGFIQQKWKFNQKYSLTAGFRTNYWDFTKEILVAPRATISHKPNWKKDYLFRFSTGIYYQPPFYKELKNLNGTVNANVKAQKSIHFVFGSDYNFRAWGNRQFKFVTEAYYKQLSNLIPYQIDNVQIRYLPNQVSNGYTAGLDFKINGEFVKGIDSWASLSFLSSKEDIENDSYIDDNGNTITPGHIARPTDQRFNFSIFFQDYLPSNPSFKVHLNLVYGSGLPFGPATGNRNDDVFRMPAYKRVDIGFSKQLKDERSNAAGLFKHFNTSWISLEIFNLLASNNTISYIWVKDFENRSYAVPNFLTSRRLNLKLIMEF